MMAQIYRRCKVDYFVYRRSYSSNSHYEHYKILRVSPNATQKEIKDAFVRRSKELHPDITGNKNHEEFVKLTEAYSLLSKENQKKDSRSYKTVYDEAYNPYNANSYQQYYQPRDHFKRIFKHLPWTSEDMAEFSKTLPFNLFILSCGIFIILLTYQLNFIREAKREQRITLYRVKDGS